MKNKLKIINKYYNANHRIVISYDLPLNIFNYLYKLYYKSVGMF